MKPPFYQISMSAPAYFRVELPDTSYVYTLGRMFKISLTGLLETQQDYPFYENIQLTLPFNNPLDITPQGEVKQLIAGVWTTIGQIKAVLFEFPNLLNDLGNGYFTPTEGSGLPVLGDPGGIGLFANIKVSYQLIFDVPKLNPHVVMKVALTDYNGILALLRTVISSLTINSAVYPTPYPSLLTLGTKATTLDNLITSVNSGNHSMTGLRDEAAVDAYLTMQEEMIYVNLTANGDSGLLELSGYPIVDEPNPRPTPEQVSIKKITEGHHPHTAKIYIERLSQTSLMFRVQATQTPDVEASWKDVLITSNSHELVIENRVHGQLWWYRLNARNASGEGLWSSPVSFISNF